MHSVIGTSWFTRFSLNPSMFEMPKGVEVKMSQDILHLKKVMNCIVPYIDHGYWRLLQVILPPIFSAF